MRYLKKFESYNQDDDDNRLFRELETRINAGDPEMVKAILSQHPDLLNYQDHYDSSGWTPLIFAVNAKTDKNLEVVKTIIDAGADVNAVDGFGWTALIHVGANEVEHQFEIIQMLLDAGADPYIKDFPPDEKDKVDADYKGQDDFYDTAQVWVQEWIQKNLPEYWEKKKKEFIQQQFDL